MLGRNYLVRRAALFIKLAQSTSDHGRAAAMITKAADLKEKIDESVSPDVAPLAPDVEEHPGSQER